MLDLSALFYALLVYCIGVIMPGPANLSIASTAMSHGRKLGVIQALGVISG